MSEQIWSFGEHPYYKFTKNSSAHRSFFSFKGGTEVPDGGIFLTEKELNLGNLSIQLTDISDFRLIFLPDRRLFEIELKPGYPEKYLFIASYRSTKGVMKGSFEMIYLFSYLCRLLPIRPSDYRLSLQNVDVKITYDKPVYLPGDRVLAQITIGKKVPKLTSEIEIDIGSNISTWKGEGVIVQGHSYHQEYTSTHNFGKKCVELSHDKVQKSIEIDYTLPENLILPMLNTHGRPFEITHEISIRYKRKILQDVYARFLIPYLPNVEIKEAKSITMTQDSITATIDKDVLYSKDTVEIDVKLQKEFTYDGIRLEFLRRISHRVYKSDPKKLERDVDYTLDTDLFTQDMDHCMFEVSTVKNFPLKLNIPHEVIPSYDSEPLVQFEYFIRVVFVRKLAKDHKVELPITFYPNWKDFKK